MIAVSIYCCYLIKYRAKQKNLLLFHLKNSELKEIIYNILNPLHLIFNQVNGYFKEINGSKYLKLVPTNENKEKIKKYEDLWSIIRDLIRSITKNSDDYDEKYMKIKFNLADELPLNKTIETASMEIVVRAIFYENNKDY